MVSRHIDHAVIFSAYSYVWALICSLHVQVFVDILFSGGQLTNASFLDLRLGRGDTGGELILRAVSLWDNF